MEWLSYFFVIFVCVFGLVVIFEVVRRKDWYEWWKHYDAEPYNFPLKYKGKTLWHSRACAVASFIFAKNKEGEWCVLANKRGEGTPDFQGMWNCPCGYLSYSETCDEAARRETKEEVGLDFTDAKKYIFEFMELNDDPVDSNNQNITVRFRCIIQDQPTEELVPHTTNEGEENEVAELAWIPVKDIENYQWAFNHEKIIPRYAPNENSAPF